MSAIDWERSACLCQAGLTDYVAAVCVADTGEEVLWLVNVMVLDGGCDHALHGDADQPHERLGHLPRRVYDRIWSTQGDDADSRCGRPRADGQPCRQRVSDPGAACCFHTGSGVSRR